MHIHLRLRPSGPLVRAKVYYCMHQGAMWQVTRAIEPMPETRKFPRKIKTLQGNGFEGTPLM